LRVVVPDVPALERFILDFLTEVPGVGSIRSSFALEQVKLKAALTRARRPGSMMVPRRPFEPDRSSLPGDPSCPCIAPLPSSSALASRCLQRRFAHSPV
jgi:hypothetical protein